MNVKVLDIRIGERRAGILFQFAREDAPWINRFVADRSFMAETQPPTLSLSYLAASEQDQALLWQDYRNPIFNGRLSKHQSTWLLPAFFQNLLPEGVFRDQVARLRGCAPSDHFELLAACGRDLPGNVYALPLELNAQQVGDYIKPYADGVEMITTAEPLEQGVSLSGLQPKLGVIKDRDRYVGRTKDNDTHIIAKLPVVAHPLLPEVEDLSLRLAKAAGVNACDAYLEPLGKLVAGHDYDLGEAGQHTNFLAVVRYDRQPSARVHCEDFAQVFGVMPEDKYSNEFSYLQVADVLLTQPSLAENAVHELLRRILVNEMLGNPDMHLKNIGLWYPDGKTPELPPAYDIVADTIYTPVTGHGLRILPSHIESGIRPKPLRDQPQRTQQSKEPTRPKQPLLLTPSVLRVFCNNLGIAERPALKAMADCAKAAYASWPDMIQGSLLTSQQKQRLLKHFLKHHAIVSLARRDQRQQS